MLNMWNDYTVTIRDQWWNRISRKKNRFFRIQDLLDYIFHNFLFDTDFMSIDAQVSNVAHRPLICFFFCLQEEAVHSITPSLIFSLTIQARKRTKPHSSTQNNHFRSLSSLNLLKLLLVYCEVHWNTGSFILV